MRSKRSFTTIITITIQRIEFNTVKQTVGHCQMLLLFTFVDIVNMRMDTHDSYQKSIKIDCEHLQKKNSPNHQQKCQNSARGTKDRTKINAQALKRK